MSDIASKLDAGPSWGSGSNQRWFDSLSDRWFLVDGSVPSQKSFSVLIGLLLLADISASDSR